VKKYNKRIRKEECETLQSSLKVVTSWKRFCQVVFVSGKYMSEAIERGVKIRYIMNLPENGNVKSNSLRYIMGTQILRSGMLSLFHKHSFLYVTKKKHIS